MAYIISYRRNRSDDNYSFNLIPSLGARAGDYNRLAKALAESESIIRAHISDSLLISQGANLGPLLIGELTHVYEAMKNASPGEPLNTQTLQDSLRVVLDIARGRV